MSGKIDLLVLTDHAGHSSENSLYALLRAFRRNEDCGRLDIASRSHRFNKAFFEGAADSRLMVSPVDESFSFDESGIHLSKKQKAGDLGNYNIIFLRLPPPLKSGFLNSLKLRFDDRRIVNRPSGIMETSSKAFLLQFPDLCPPMHLCRNREDVLYFARDQDIVLKPLNEYGGKGILRVSGKEVNDGGESFPLDHFFEQWDKSRTEYLGMKYLKNVGMGDKRVLVVNKKIMGASLRLPAKGSWLCNVAQGGEARGADVDERERKMARRLSDVLYDKGVAMFGFDTLVGDDGQRMLSEINTTSIGGIMQMESQSGSPVLKETALGLFDYFKKILNERNRSQ